MKLLLHSLKILPFCSVMLIMLGACHLRLGEYPLCPALLLIPVYYWMIFRPDWLPLWSLVGAGIFYDALIGSDLGVSAFLLVLSAAVAHSIRPLLASQHFFLIWGGFCVYSLFYVTLYGILSSGDLPLLFSWIYGIILFPLLAWALGHLHLKLQSYV